MFFIVNNGTFGTVFNVQHKENGDSFAARHVKALNVRSNLRDEASILWQLRNVPELIQLQGKIGCFVIVYFPFSNLFFFFTTQVISYNLYKFILYIFRSLRRTSTICFGLRRSYR